VVLLGGAPSRVMVLPGDVVVLLVVLLVEWRSVRHGDDPHSTGAGCGFARRSSRSSNPIVPNSLRGRRTRSRMTVVSPNPAERGFRCRGRDGRI
jgi:hypothetical protein